MRLTGDKERFSSPAAFDPLQTPELMEELMVLLDTLETSLPSLVWWEAEVVQCFESNSGGPLARGLLYYSRKKAYHAFSSEGQF